MTGRAGVGGGGDVARAVSRAEMPRCVLVRVRARVRVRVSAFMGEAHVWVDKKERAVC